VGAQIGRRTPHAWRPNDHGVTKEVTFKVEGPTPEIKDPWGATRIGFAAKTKIHRKDFGLGWNVVLEAGGLTVGEEVTITIEAQFVKHNVRVWTGF